MAVEGDRRETPVRPSDARVAELNALADLHAEWTAEHAGGAAFNPKGRKPGSDYNVHHVDLEADQAAMDDFYRRSVEIFAGAPGTDLPDDGVGDVP